MNIEEVIAYKCGKCGCTYIDKRFAEKCCAPKHCDKCGCELPEKSYYTLCDTCREQEDILKEKRRYCKAIKANWDDVPWEYKEMMYSKVYEDNEGYFSDIEDLEIHCEECGIEMPKYVWSTDIVEISMDAMSFAETACEQSFEDAIDHIEREEIEDLQEFLDEWCARQTGTKSYAVNYKYAILI